MTVRVRFLKTHGLWNKGEVAGFIAERAAEFIKAGVAEDADAADLRAEADAQAKAEAEPKAKADAEAAERLKAEAEPKAKADAEAAGLPRRRASRPHA